MGLMMSHWDTTLQRQVCPTLTVMIDIGFHLSFWSVLFFCFFFFFLLSAVFPPSKWMKASIIFYNISHLQTARKYNSQLHTGGCVPSDPTLRAFYNPPAISHPSLGFSIHNRLLFFSALNLWKGGLKLAINVHCRRELPLTQDVLRLSADAHRPPPTGKIGYLPFQASASEWHLTFFSCF